ncbi:hypothetical protein ACFLV0_05830 [Chloroflexota bacterium]
MAKDSKEAEKTKNAKLREISFKCQSCGQHKLSDEMRSIKRFFPVLVVCQECEKKMR